ncbi:hypothetical protein ACCO45_007883 [Purpureocillium lilacinum]|uniref:Uncharacterized protein n=1 Tax=Purpureocillium lilacinum TaxID=33203 RepID=A0ACC4DPS7_PURLI
MGERGATNVTFAAPPPAGRHHAVVATLLSLPLELRSQIYDHLLELQAPAAVYITRATHPNDGEPLLEYTREPRTHRSLAIFRVNKQIYKEALQQLYNKHTFHIMADECVVTAFFGQMSRYARSNVRRLQTKPQPQKITRVPGVKANISQVLWAPSWSVVCASISDYLVGLDEIGIHLNSWDGYLLESGGDLGWLFAPLATLTGVRKTLVGVRARSRDLLTDKMINRWEEEITRTESERAAHLAFKSHVKGNDAGTTGTEQLHY